MLLRFSGRFSGCVLRAPWGVAIHGAPWCPRKAGQTRTRQATKNLLEAARQHLAADTAAHSVCAWMILDNIHRQGVPHLRGPVAADRPYNAHEDGMNYFMNFMTFMNYFVSLI